MPAIGVSTDSCSSELDPLARPQSPIFLSSRPQRRDLAPPGAIVWRGASDRRKRNCPREHNGRRSGTLYRRLVYCKESGQVAAAIGRAWQLKRWKRQKKIALVESVKH